MNKSGCSNDDRVDQQEDMKTLLDELQE